MNRLYTSKELGKNYISDGLTTFSNHKVKLTINTEINGQENYGRSSIGWYVKGGIKNSYLEAYADSGILLGNRSLLARFKFVSTQTGVNNGQHGLFQILLVQSDWIGMNLEPIRVCVDNGKFYILDLKSDLIAGNNEEQVFYQHSNIEYTLSTVLFQKGVYARLSGNGIPGGYIEINISDRKRFIPGYPGFALEGNPQAYDGEVIIKDWLVTPIGPYMPVIGAIGDSITAGLDGDIEENSYIKTVTCSIRQELILNTGSGGSTTSIDLKRFPIEIAPFKPYIVWIEGGTNDITANVSAQEVYHNMLEEIKLIDWGGIPLLSTVPPRNTDNYEQNIQRNILNDLIRSSGYLFVDRNKILAADQGTHINAIGSRLIAEEAYKKINEIPKIRAVIDEKSDEELFKTTTREFVNAII
jgi:lysophospholipase L1-like esterase